MTNGLQEEFEVPVRDVTLQYGCASCRYNGTEYGNKCKINPMFTVVLLMRGQRKCPLHNKSEEYVEQWLGRKEN